MVARAERSRPTRPRPSLCSRRFEARRARLAEPNVVPGRVGGDGRLVPSERGLVAGGEGRRLARVLRAPVRREARRVDGGVAVRVAVTGAGGRLGRAVIGTLEDAAFAGPFGPIAWERVAFDLDRTDTFGPLIDRDRPEVVVHCAAWTDVDGCARDPDLANTRNGTATATLAAECARRGLDLVVVST